MVLGCINRTAWGTRLLLMAVWASLVVCISSWHFQGTALPFESEWVVYPAFGSPPHPPPTHPPPIESIRDITGTEKNCLKNQQL